MLESGSQPGWVTVAEAARALEITETAVRKRIRSGLLPARGARGSTEVLISVDNRNRTGSQIEKHGLEISESFESARLAGEVAELRARLADLQEDRDRWHQAALEARQDARDAHVARAAAERELRMLLTRG